MFKKILAALAFTALSVSAFAQHGTWGYQNNTRQWAPPGVAVNQNVQNGSFVSGIPVATGYPAGAVLVQQGAAAPQGYCSWGERFLNVAASTGIGAVFGALAGDSTRAAGKGAAAGVMVGVFIPCQQPVQQGGVVRQLVAPGQAQQGSVTVYAPQGSSGFMCAVEGIKEVFLVKDPSTCPQIAGNIAKAKVGTALSSQEAAPAAQHEGPAVFTPKSEGVPASIPMTCRIGTAEGMYRFNVVDGRKITPEECAAYKQQQTPLPPKDKMAIG